MAGKIREERLVQLKEIQKQLLELNDDIQNVIDEETSMTELATKINISAQTLNNELNKGLFALLNKVKILTDKDIEQLIRDAETPYEKLVRVILRTDELFVLSIADEDRIFKMLQEALSEREVKVLCCRFGLDGGKALTLEETRRIFDVTRDRIHRIEAKVLAKLRHPKYLRKILPDYDLKIKELTELRDMIFINNTLDSQIESCKEQVEKRSLTYNTGIEELGLSYRSYNCLRRSRIDTIADLSKMTICDLMKIRNIGIVSKNEIVNALEERFGIVLEYD